jgi:toluene monooxygenase system ferredoxin subunit
MAIQDALKKADLFAGLSDSTMQAIAKLARPASYEEGDKVYEIGDDATDLYLVDSGRVRFSIGVGNRDGAASVMTKGQVFGWAALLEDRPRRVATALCLEDTDLFVIPVRPLLDLFKKDTAGGYLVMRRLATMVARDFMSMLVV